MNMLNIKSIFSIKKKYGRLGKLSYSEWKSYLHSNKGLFVKSPKETDIIGPTLTKDAQIIGDMMAMEASIFGIVATQDQIDFSNELIKENYTAYLEYILTISGSIERWKKDMKIIQDVLNELEKEEKELKKNEEILSNARTHEVSKTLKKHFPQIFKGEIFKGKSFTELIQEIKDSEKKVEDIIDYLKNYIKDKRKKMPFLFEN